MGGAPAYLAGNPPSRMPMIADRHLEFLAWLAEHEGAPHAEAAPVLGVSIAEVERLLADLMAEGMLERSRFQ